MFPHEWPDCCVLITYAVLGRNGGGSMKTALIKGTSQEQFFEHLVADVLGATAVRIDNVMACSSDVYDMLLPNFLANRFLVMDEGDVQ